MNDQLNNILCKCCGHKRQHHYLEHWMGGGSDYICSEDNTIYHLCSFEMDSLSLLEMEYEKTLR